MASACRFLHADAYAGFDKLYAPDTKTGCPRLRAVACWAHARQELFEEHARTKSLTTFQALEKIGAIFAIEREIKGRAPDIRRAVRQDPSVPLLEESKASMEAALARISRKTDLAKAINYSLNRWEALCRFANDGRLELTNNAAERAIRPLTLGRRNSTFLGADSGSKRAAILYTLIQTCKFNDVNPQAYLADLVSRIGAHPNSRIDELLPWNWPPAAALPHQTNGGVMSGRLPSRYDRIDAPCVFDGPINGQDFIDYVVQCLVPVLLSVTFEFGQCEQVSGHNHTDSKLMLINTAT